MPFRVLRSWDNSTYASNFTTFVFSESHYKKAPGFKKSRGFRLTEVLLETQCQFVNEHVVVVNFGIWISALEVFTGEEVSRP